MPRYAIEWKTTVIEEHFAVVDADTLATMLGVDVSALEGVEPGDVDNIRDVSRGLANGLADIEDSDTEVGIDGPYRDDITVRAAADDED
jgi:hypothetical protein